MDIKCFMHAMIGVRDTTLRKVKGAFSSVLK